MPSRAFFSIACACNGISGLDHASGAGEIVGIRFAGHFENGDGDFSASGGRLRNHSASAQIASPVWRIHCPLWLSLLRRRSYRTSAGCETALGRNRRQFRIVQRINQRMNVVTTLHSAQQFNGFFWETSGEVVSPFATAARKPALT